MGWKAIERVLGRVEAALTAEPKRTSSVLRNRETPERAMAEVNTLFELSCACALADKPYVLQFEWTRAGKLRFLRAIKGEDGAAAGSRRSVASTPPQQFAPVDAFESLDFPCPWCGDVSLVHCSRCGTLVCSRRTRNRLFLCRASCGAVSFTVPVKGLGGQAKTDASGPSAAPQATSGKALPAAGAAPIARRTPQGAGIVKKS